MSTKTKRFDCVEMKDAAQRRLREEYESRRHEFASYAEFIAAVSDESSWVSATWARFGGGDANARS
jgi:hypothetical protein